MRKLVRSCGVMLGLLAGGELSAQGNSIVVSFDGRFGTAQTTGDFGGQVDGGISFGVGAAIRVHPHVSLLVGIDAAFLERAGQPVLLFTRAGSVAPRNDVVVAAGGGENVTATRLLGGVGLHLTNRARSRVIVMPRAEFGIQIFAFDSGDQMSTAISGGLTLGYDVSRNVTLLGTVRLDGSFVDERSFPVRTEQVLIVPIMIGASVKLD